MTDTRKYDEIIAKRKIERESEDDDAPIRFKMIRTVDGGVALVKA